MSASTACRPTTTQSCAAARCCGSAARRTVPSFKVEIEKAKAALPDTEIQDKVKTWREMLADTRRLGAAGLGTLAALLSAAVVYFMIQADSLESQIETAKAEAVELASKSFSPAVLSEAAAAVHLVVKKDGKKLVPMATAWAFAPDKLGTNAHVTEALDGAEFELCHRRAALRGGEGRRHHRDQGRRHPSRLRQVQALSGYARHRPRRQVHRARHHHPIRCRHHRDRSRDAAARRPEDRQARHARACVGR